MAGRELLNESSRPRYGGRSRWLRLSLFGVITLFAAVPILIAVAIVEELVSGSGRELAALPVNILFAIVGIVWLAGFALIPIGVVGWVATADDWGDRFTRLTRLGLIMIPVSLVSGFGMAFATQDGTDVEGKLAVAAFFLLGFPIGTLIATVGYIGRRRYDNRAEPEHP